MGINHVPIDGHRQDIVREGQGEGVTGAEGHRYVQIAGRTGPFSFLIEQLKAAHTVVIHQLTQGITAAVVEYLGYRGVATVAPTHLDDLSRDRHLVGISGRPCRGGARFRHFAHFTTGMQGTRGSDTGLSVHVGLASVGGGIEIGVRISTSQLGGSNDRGGSPRTAWLLEFPNRKINGREGGTHTEDHAEKGCREEDLAYFRKGSILFLGSFQFQGTDHFIQI